MSSIARSSSEPLKNSRSPKKENTTKIKIRNNQPDINFRHSIGLRKSLLTVLTAYFICLIMLRPCLSASGEFLISIFTYRLKILVEKREPNCSRLKYFRLTFRLPTNPAGEIVNYTKTK